MFRLNTDPAVLTPGRFYFASWDTPSSPVGSLRASRNYVAEDGQAFLEWGEVDGPQKWDNGAPPVFEPLPKLVGTEDCLNGGGDDAEAAAPGSNFFRVVCIAGRDYHFPAIIYASFSIARHDSEFTYYNDVPLTLTDATCEARYEGPSGIPNVTAIMRVTDSGDGSLFTNFYLCDSSPPPPIYNSCCVHLWPAVFTRTMTIEAGGPGGFVLWSVDVTDLEFTWQGITAPFGIYTAPFVCGSIPYLFTVKILDDGGCKSFWTLERTDTHAVLFTSIELVVTCWPPNFGDAYFVPFGPGDTFEFCGHTAVWDGTTTQVEVRWGPMMFTPF